MFTVLVVDADSLSRRAATEILEKEGYRAIEASNSLHALLIAANFRPPIDVLMADAGLPGIHGRGLIEKFSQAFPATPAALIEKPLEPEALVENVKELLKRKGPYRSARASSAPLTAAERSA